MQTVRSTSSNIYHLNKFRSFWLDEIVLTETTNGVVKTTDVTIAVNGNKWVVCFLAKYEIPLPLNFFIILFIKRLGFTYFVASNAFCNLFIATLTVLFHSLVCKVWNLHSLFRKCKRYLQTNWTLQVFIYLFLF